MMPLPGRQTVGQVLLNVFPTRTPQSPEVPS